MSEEQKLEFDESTYDYEHHTEFDFDTVPETPEHEFRPSAPINIPQTPKSPEKMMDDKFENKIYNEIESRCRKRMEVMHAWKSFISLAACAGIPKIHRATAIECAIDMVADLHKIYPGHPDWEYIVSDYLIISNFNDKFDSLYSQNSNSSKS